MDQKTKTVLIVVAAVVVVGGAYYGFNRWRQQQMANQILRDIYGVNTGAGGVLNKITGGATANQIAQEIANQTAKDEAQQKADAAKAAAMTPEEKYNAAEEMPAYDAGSKESVAMIKGILEKVFGKAKLTSISSNAYGTDQTGYVVMEFKIARLATGEDLATLNATLKDKSLPVVQSGIMDKTASVTAGNAQDTMYSFGFDINGQDVGVNIIKASK
jgi:hypothetical protein